MSDNSIELEASDLGVPDRRVFIGWDRGLGTFFVRVTDGFDDDGELVLRLMLGTCPDEISTAAAAIEAIRPYAIIPDNLPAVLAAQHDAPGAQQRSPFVALIPRRPAPAAHAGPGVGPSPADLIEACEIGPAATPHDAETDPAPPGPETIDAAAAPELAPSHRATPSDRGHQL
ncbi:hypothetical protein [Nocardia sp. NPDC050435]|uniref:hypothetical protein n=1 Tax=Nocardia sp. NPDC050435 TaxID=3155040 RepID=UPI0033F5E264